MEYRTTLDDKECEIFLSGRFTFFDHQRFHEILSLFSDGKHQAITLNFQGVEFIDSAALGMLLLAKDEAEKHHVKLVLRKPVGQVAKMLHVAEFDSLFQMEK